MTQEEASASIAYLADKLSKSLSRITALERDLKRFDPTTPYPRLLTGVNRFNLFITTLH